MDDLALWRLREAAANKWDSTNIVMRRGDLAELLTAYDHEAAARQRAWDALCAVVSNDA
jgi:hypothetical protein